MIFLIMIIVFYGTWFLCGIIKFNMEMNKVAELERQKRHSGRAQ